MGNTSLVQVAPPTRFERAISCVTGRRPLRAGPRGRAICNPQFQSSRVDSNHRSAACKAVALAAEPRDVQPSTVATKATERRAVVRHFRAETEGIEPPTLAGSRFRDGFLDHPGSLQAAAARNDRALARSKRAVPTFTLRRNTKQAERRIERRLTGSEPVVRPLHQEPTTLRIHSSCGGWYRTSEKRV